MDIRNNFFSKRVGTHWHRLPRVVPGSPSLEVLKRKSKWSTEGCGHGGGGSGLNLEILEGFSYLYDSIDRKAFYHLLPFLFKFRGEGGESRGKIPLGKCSWNSPAG